jgi:hypothetical protein
MKFLDFKIGLLYHSRWHFMPFVAPETTFGQEEFYAPNNYGKTK